jgi:hypothetical protein
MSAHLALASFLASTAVAAPPVAWWKLDDNAASATVSDSSGNNLTGTFYSGLSPQNTSLAHSSDRPEGSGSLIFDGINDYVTITGYKGITGGGSRTCAAWVKTTASQQGAIVAWGSISVNGQSWVFRVEQGGQLGVGVFGGSIKTTATTLNDNTWHHVAAVLTDDGTPNVNEVKLYIDGVQQSTTATAYAISTAAAADVRIGAFTGALNDVPNMYFKGLLDDVQIYDYALSAAEIQALNTWKPAPRDGAINLPLDTDPSWATQPGVLSYNVYFGIDSNAVAAANNQPLPGDINLDRAVDIHDLSILADQWQTNPGVTNQSADLLYDGIVNFRDFALLAAAWTQTTVFKGNQSGTNYDPGLLDYNRNYYWRVDVVGGSSTTAGPVRRFTTVSDGSLPAMAMNPTPANGGTNVSTAVTYSWSAASGATSYRVYRGTSLPLTGSPTTVLVPSLSGGTLANNTTFYWRVDTANVSGTTTGAVWSFTTELLTSPPGPAGSPSPAHGENFVSPYADLAWTAGSNAVAYNVYFGTVNPPPLVGQTTGTNFDPGVLTTNLTYYWRVEGTNSVGTTTGAVWTFTTEARLTPEQFAILAWDGPDRSYPPFYDVPTCNTMRDCGFNVAGFVQKAYFDSVAAAGLKAFAFDWNTCPATETMVNWPRSMIDYYVNPLVNQVSNHPALFGYFVRDEPPVTDFPGLGNWRASFKAADPDKLVYMSLGWDYDYASYLALTGQDDFLSYDFYGVLEDGRIHSYYFPCLEKARGASVSSGLPFWNVVSSIDGYSDNPDWNTAPPSPENLRFQLYTSLAYGVKGISWFTYFSQNLSAPIQYGQKTAIWYYLQDVNMQMHRIGQTYITLTNNNVFHHPNVPPGQPYMNHPARGLATSQHVQTISGGDFVVGEFTDPADEKFILVVNKSLTTNATINVTFKSAGTIQRVNSANGQLQPFTQGQSLLPGEGMLLKLVN